jgi:drug/metabolite transporter (DMT)-like permease
LGEFLSLTQWIAIVIVVLGVVLSSLKQRVGHRVTWLGKSILLPLVSSVLLALSDITAKYALADISPWGMYAITSLCVAVTFLAISLRPSVIRQLVQMPKRNTSLLIIGFNEVMVVAARILFYWAMSIGSVSLVSTVSSTRPIFVFIFAFTISRFSPLLYEYESDTRILLFRFLAIALIVGGVAIIYLT